MGSDENQDIPVPKRDSRKRLSWDAITAVMAVIIAFIATLVSAYTAWEQHQQTTAQVWPHLLVGSFGVLPSDTIENGTLTSHGGGLVAESSGVGPAIISRIEVLVNGKPQAEWQDVFLALGYKPGELHHTQAELSGNVLPPGKSIYWLMVFGHAPWQGFLDKLNAEVVIHVCYRSALNDFWMATLDKGDWSSRAVSSCASISKRNQFAG